MTDRILYKRGKPGQVLVWYMTQDGNAHTTTHGVQGGKLTTSAPTVCTGKQGRNDEEQAAFEVNSGYEYQLKRTYFETIDEIDTPRFFQPMLATKWKDTTFEKCQKLIEKERVSARSLQGTGLFSEPKLDGFCAIVQATGMTSREGQPIVSAPHILSALGEFFHYNPDAVLHGELYNHELKDEFEELSSILKQQTPTEDELRRSRESIQFHVYDYPSPGVINLPYSERRELLAMDLPESQCVRIVPSTPLLSDAHAEETRSQLVDDGYEGQMIKLDLPYRIGKRSKSNLKNKVFDDMEFELICVEPGVGNYAAYAKRAKFRTAAGVEFGAGIKGGQSAFNKALLGNWRDTQRVATVQFFGWTNGNKPRMATVKAWHGLERTL